MKIRPVGAELFHADGRTDKTKLTVAFRNFGNAPKKLDTAHTFYLYIPYDYYNKQGLFHYAL
jgi:hypothetical protein